MNILKPIPTGEGQLMPSDGDLIYAWFRDGIAEDQVVTFLKEFPNGKPGVLLKKTDESWDSVTHWWPIPRLEELES